MSLFGDKLRRVRNDRNLTQEEMANLLNTSKQVISRYENGQRSPKVSIVAHYAEQLGINPAYFLGNVFPQRLLDIITFRHMSLEEIAKAIDVMPLDVERMIAGDLDPTYEQFKALAQYLNVTEDCLDGKTSYDIVEPGAVTPFPSNVRPISDLHRQRVPHIGSVAAGEPIYAPDDLGVYVDSPVDCDAALTVQGDSMAPTYLDGDVIYIKCRPDVPDGTVAVVFLDDEAALKHVYKRPAGLTLVSDNPEYPPRMIEFQEYSNVRIFGVPVGYTRIYKKDPLKKLKKGFK